MTDEESLRAAFAVGRRVRFDAKKPKVDRTVRGELLSSLLVEPLPGSALRLVGAHVTGPFALEGLTVTQIVDFVDCTFDHTPDLRMARLTSLRMRGCKVPGLWARNLRVGSDLVLEAGFTSDGVVDLTDATVDGTFRLAGAVLKAKGDHALLAARIRLSGSLQAIALRAGGEVRMRGANIGGSVHLGGARLLNPGQNALDGSGITIAGNLFCDAEGGRFTADGRILLDGARVGGNVVFSGARLKAGVVDRPVLVIPRGTADESAALVADRIHVEGNVELDDGFTSSGTVRLPNAEVGGYLRLSGAAIGQQDVVEELSAREVVDRVPVALHADGIQVRGDLEARGAVNGGFRGGGSRESALRAYGQVRLVDAHVRGSASLSGVQLHGPGIDVLFADRLTVGGTLFLRDLHAKGSLRLQNAAIGSTLDCSGATLVQPRRRPDGAGVKPSLDARVATIGKDLLCSHGFTATGGVRIRLAEVGKMATFTGARLGGPGSDIALNAYGLTVSQLVLRMAEDVIPVGRVVLRRVSATAVQDGPGLWAATGGVDVEDFTFSAISSTPPVDVHTRLRWLREVQPDFAPGPYEQLAAVYRDGGEEELAQHVQLEKQHRRYSELGHAGRVWGFLQRWTVGYGYRPWLAIAWLAAFWLLGALWFLGHEMPKLNDDESPSWNPWLLAVDLLIPIVDLGQDGKWKFSGASQWISSALIAVGWILASTAAAGAARVLKRV
ncbi:oxidoreductase [Saccharothrix mutabilis subsp. mutabilis]|uniref:Oxidoreductase n=1 Tax=Saccharothrix mutabilis subsp. mutabilis TaxID=66855 RepID=A0ABN0TM50_9PSEU